MKTIQITIQVPDGVDVKVSQGSASSGNGDFVERPDPPEPEGACPEHGTPWRMVKGGVSKRTGKRFNSFWVCSTNGCDIKPGDLVEVDNLPF